MQKCGGGEEAHLWPRAGPFQLQACTEPPFIPFQEPRSLLGGGWHMQQLGWGRVTGKGLRSWGSEKRGGNWRHWDPGKQPRVAKPGGTRLRGQGCFSLCKRRMGEAVSLRVTCHHWVHWAPKGGVGMSTASASGGEEGEHPVSGEIQEGGQGACFGHRREPKPDILMSYRVCCSNSAKEFHRKQLPLPPTP